MRILHIHPTIGIGGVETYLKRLGREQVRAGHTVSVLTAGGAFEDSFARAGIGLYKVRPKPENFERGLELIGDARFDIIHGHNYKAARFGKRLSERIGGAFLMSVHGPRPLWHRLLFSDWSERVIAMSEGDRDNVTSLGGIRPDRVHLSFYGIETDRFRPGLEVAGLRDELGLPDSAIPIVYVSRFAHQKAGVALALLGAMPEVCAAVPDAVVLLVGEGPEEERLRARVEEINRQTGRQAARFVGPRRDVERLMNLGAVVVAAANTALEALACGTPTLAAGRTGYFGRVTAARLEEARAVCFADHGRLAQRASAALFAREVLAVLSDLPAVREAARGVQAIAADRYNAARMAEDIEAVYRHVLAGGGEKSLNIV